MQAAGGTLVKHYRDLAFMGFLEVSQTLENHFGQYCFLQKRYSRVSTRCDCLY